MDTHANVASVNVPDSEMQARVELAAAFRWFARIGLHEGIANHFSFAVSDDGRQFLMNPFWGAFLENARQ